MKINLFTNVEGYKPNALDYTGLAAGTTYLITNALLGLYIPFPLAIICIGLFCLSGVNRVHRIRKLRVTKEQVDPQWEIPQGENNHNTTEAAEIITRRAAEEVECDCVYELEECLCSIEGRDCVHGPINCSTCGGSGKVPRFPTLRVKCPCYTGNPCTRCVENAGVNESFYHSFACHSCPGVPGSDYTIPPQDQWLEVGIEIAKQRGLWLRDMFEPDSGDIVLDYWRTLDQTLTQEKL